MEAKKSVLDAESWALATMDLVSQLRDKESRPKNTYTLT